MKKLTEILGLLIAVGSVASVVILIEQFQFQIFYLGFLAIAIISFTPFNSLLAKWTPRINANGVNTIKLLLNSTRALCSIFLLLLFAIPKLYKSLPLWVNKEAVSVINEIPKDKLLYINLMYRQKFDTANEDVYLLKRVVPSIVKPDSASPATGQRAYYVFEQIVGTPNLWLTPLAATLMGISVALLLFTFIAKSLTTNT